MAVIFTLQDPKITKALRKDFERRRLNNLYVMWLYRKGYLEKYAHLMNLERAKKGRIPRGFDVHHIVPLSGGGRNWFSNFCLIEKSLHKFINKKCFEPALRGIKPGETVRIELPDFGRVALRRDYNGFIDRKLQHAKDRSRFYRFLHQWRREK